MPCNLLITKEA